MALPVIGPGNLTASSGQRDVPVNRDSVYQSGRIQAVVPKASMIPGAHDLALGLGLASLQPAIEPRGKDWPRGRRPAPERLIPAGDNLSVVSAL
jgi:hypothetical protein